MSPRAVAERVELAPVGAGLGRWTLGRRPALDGVRGLAIVFVLVTHTGASAGWPTALRWVFGGGASVGVTLFFVLSGFLITALLAEELRDTGRLDFVAFYRRRALRLLPALLLLVLILAVFSGLARDWRPVSLQKPVDATQILATVFYVANWVTIYGHDHNLGFLNHTWSLAIEEQFYIIWPAILVAGAILFGLRSKLLAFLVLALAVVSGGDAAWRYWSTAGTAGGRVYFGTDTRACALLLGCALALWLVSDRRLFVPATLLGAGLCLLALSFVYADNRFVFKVPVPAAVGGALLVAAALQEGRTAALLSWRPLRWSGQISYGIYLWHLPIILVLQQVLVGVPSVVRLTLMVLASYGVACASYYLVERHFLRLKRTSSRVPDSVSATSGG